MKTPMKTDLPSVRQFIATHAPEQVAAFDVAYAAADEVVIIGSAAVGQLGPRSDLDLLFVGEGKRMKTRRLDFIWITRKKQASKSWLGSELATHAAGYGVWLKGSSEWKPRVFFSRLAVTHKCERILVRLAKLYAKRHALSHSRLVSLVARCVTDMQRVVLLDKKLAVPPSGQVLQGLLEHTDEMFDRACAEPLLGQLGRFFIEQFIPRTEVIEFLKQERREKAPPGAVGGERAKQ